jgi:hypothetical protein
LARDMCILWGTELSQEKYCRYLYLRLPNKTSVHHGISLEWNLPVWYSHRHIS